MSLVGAFKVLIELLVTIIAEYYHKQINGCYIVRRSSSAFNTYILVTSSNQTHFNGFLET